MNIAMDYSWYAKDTKWQQDYGKRFQNFLFCRGIDTFEDQFMLDGSLPEQKEILETRLIAWMKDTVQTDDVTVMGIRL